jgi:hypothetical protein
MTETRKKRPRDPVPLAKLIGDIATRQIEDREQDERNPAAVELGRLGGRKAEGHANKLTAERRRQIAQAVAKKRWR